MDLEKSIKLYNKNNKIRKEKQRAYDRKRYHEKLKFDSNYKKRAAKRSQKRMRISINNVCSECRARHLASLVLKEDAK